MGIPTTKKLYKLSGLSTETKPIFDDMCTGSTFLELDTGITYVFNSTYKAWLSSAKNKDQAITKGIYKIEKTSDKFDEHGARVDTYTIYYTNGAETTFDVTNGTHISVNVDKQAKAKARNIELFSGQFDTQGEPIFDVFDITKVKRFEAELFDDSLEFIVSDQDFTKFKKDEGFFIVNLTNGIDLVFRYIHTAEDDEYWVAEQLEAIEDTSYHSDFAVITYVGKFITENETLIFRAEKKAILAENLKEELTALEERLNESIASLSDHVDQITLDLENRIDDEVDSLNTRITNEVNTLDDKINREESRASEAERNLGNRITLEEARAKGKEDSLEVLIGNESTRAQIKETELTNEDTRLANLISGEETRATTREAQLSDEITQVSDAVANETQSRQSADNTLQDNIDAEERRATTAENNLGNRIAAIEDDYLKSEDKSELQGNIDTVSNELSAEVDRAEHEESLIKDRLDDIEELIPEQASSENQLADKDFVNSSIATATATFRGSYNLVIDLGLTIDATEEQIAEAITQEMVEHLVSPDNNDYVFVQIPVTEEVPKEIEKIDRYKFDTVNWIYEYTLNNSSFTDAQWKAINSGITAEAVTQIETNKQDIISINGSISNINTAIGNINTELGEVQSDIDSLETDVSTLQDDVVTINQTIDDIKDSEKYESFKDVEEALDKLELEKASEEELTQLEETLTEVLNELKDELGNEITRAIAVENQITSNLEDEITNRQADVDAEQQRAEDKEQQLQNSIDNIDQELIAISGDVSDLQDTIDNLNLQDVGQDGSYIKIVGQKNGQLSATAQNFDTTFDTPTDSNAPTTKLVSNSLDEFSSKSLDQELVDNIYLSTCLEDGVDLVLYESDEHNVPDLLEFGEFSTMEHDPLPNAHPDPVEGNEATLEESDEIRFNSNNVALAGNTIYLGDNLVVVPSNEDTEDDNGGNN